MVSPSACKSEFKATTRINNIEPEKITLVYFNPKTVTVLVDPINLYTFSERVRPKKVITIEIKTPK